MGLGGGSKLVVAACALLLTSCDLSPRPEDPSSDLSQKGGPTGQPSASGGSGSGVPSVPSPGAGGATSEDFGNPTSTGRLDAGVARTEDASAEGRDASGARDAAAARDANGGPHRER